MIKIKDHDDLVKDEKSGSISATQSSYDDWVAKTKPLMSINNLREEVNNLKKEMTDLKQILKDMKNGS
jgi:hypothetical protein